MARPDSWFRFYNGAVDNPKVQRLTDSLFKEWVNLLCIASKNGGTLPPLEDVAFILRAKESYVEGVLQRLREKRLFDRDETGTYTPHDWADLQFKSDVSTERVKRFRERHTKRDETVSGNGNVAAQETEQSRAEQIPPVAPKGESDEELFKVFWKAYPSRGKASNPRNPALKAWKRAVHQRGAKPEDLVRLAATAAPPEKHGTEFVPQARTWLNEDRWKDLPSAVVAFINPTATDPEESRWRARLSGWQSKQTWMRDQWGPTPTEADCKAPKRLLQEFQQEDIPDFMKRGQTIIGAG